MNSKPRKSMVACVFVLGFLSLLTGWADAQPVNPAMILDPDGRLLNPASNYVLFRTEIIEIPGQGIDGDVPSYLADQNLDRVHLLASFKKLPTRADRQQLGNEGIYLLDYFPRNTYAVSIPNDPGPVDTLVNNFGRIYVQTFKPILKTEPGLYYGNFPAHATREDGSVEFLVTFFADVPVGQQRAILNAAGTLDHERVGTTRTWWVNSRRSRAQRLAQDDRISWIESIPPAIVSDNDDVTGPEGVHSDAISAAGAGDLDGTGIKILQLEMKNPSITHDDFSDRIVILDMPRPRRFQTHGFVDENDNELYDFREPIYLDMDDDWVVTGGWDLLLNPEDTTEDSYAGEELSAFDGGLCELSGGSRGEVRFHETAPKSSVSFGSYSGGKPLYCHKPGGATDSGVHVRTGDRRITHVTGFAGGEYYAYWAGTSVVDGDEDFGWSLSALPHLPHAHATHVAATMAGTGIQSENYTDPDGNSGMPRQWAGVAPAVKLESARSTPQLHNSFEHYQLSEAPLSNNSWSYTYSGTWAEWGYDTHASIIDAYASGRYVAGDPVSLISPGNIKLFIGAAGNWDQPLPVPESSVNKGANNAKNALMVANVLAQASHDRYPTSRIGPSLDGRLKPDVAGPGAVSLSESITSAIPGDTYGQKPGTSMATAAVTGTAALVIEAYRRICPHSDPPPALLRAALIHGAQRLTNGPPDFETGYGLVRAPQTVDLITRFKVGVIEDDGDTKSFDIPAGIDAPRVTLAWDDVGENPAPAPDPVYGYLVNDLDLSVHAMGGLVHYPWTLNETANDYSSRDPDHVNTVEMVEIPPSTGFATAATATGPWKVNVEGGHVAMAPQRFFLVSESFDQIDSTSCQLPPIDGYELPN